MGRVSLADSSRQKFTKGNHQFIQARLSNCKIAETGGLLNWYVAWELYERYAREGE